MQDDPYSLAGLGKCAAIIREVEELNAVLGPDVNEKVDKSEAKKREETAGRVAGTVAGGIIPFRGLIGEVTGANAERRRYAVAVYAGTVRRGFLKGVGLEVLWPQAVLMIVYAMLGLGLATLALEKELRAEVGR